MPARHPRPGLHRSRRKARRRALVEVDPGQRDGRFDDQVPRRGEREGNTTCGTVAAIASIGCVTSFRGWPSRSPTAPRRRCMICRACSTSCNLAVPAVRAARRRREQLQHGRGDDAERAFRADEELLQVVAGVVLAQRRRPFQMRPSGSTTSSPSTRSRVIAVAQHRRCRPHWSRDCRRSVQLPSAPRLKREEAVRRRARALCTSARMQPASTVMVLLSGSIVAHAVHAARAQSTICGAAGIGIAPPHMPVLPPCGTIASRLSAQ